MEIGRNGNYLLNGIYLNAMDSQLFEDVLLFHLVPQILSNFDPALLRISAFVIYVCIIVVYSSIVLILTKSKTNMLVFAALMANTELLSYGYFRLPMYHSGTILFAGVFILLFSIRNYGLVNINLKNYKGLLCAFTIIGLVFLFTFSDLMFALFFIIPFVTCYLLFYDKKSDMSNLFVITIGASGLFAYLFSKYIVNALGMAYFTTMPVSLAGLENAVLVNIPLYFEGLLLLISGNLYRALAGFTSFGYTESLTLFLLIVIIYMVVTRIIQEKTSRRKIVLTFFFFSSAIVFIPYVFTSLCVNISTTRYLTFTALLLFMIISLYFDHKNKLFPIVILLLLVVFSLSNFNLVNSLDYHPNKGEYKVLDYLKEKKLTIGYSDYWDANIFTYLSHGDVTIRSVSIWPDGLRPQKLISADRWYEEKPRDYFLLVNNAHLDDVNASEALVKKYTPGSSYHYAGYTIYVFNDSINIGCFIFPYEPDPV
jgi:hypothetical protein